MITAENFAHELCPRYTVSPQRFSPAIVSTLCASRRRRPELTGLAILLISQNQRTRSSMAPARLKQPSSAILFSARTRTVRVLNGAVKRVTLLSHSLPTRGKRRNEKGCSVLPEASPASQPAPGSSSFQKNKSKSSQSLTGGFDPSERTLQGHLTRPNKAPISTPEPTARRDSTPVERTSLRPAQ